MAAFSTPAYRTPSDRQGFLPGKVDLFEFVLPSKQMPFDVLLLLALLPLKLHVVGIDLSFLSRSFYLWEIHQDPVQQQRTSHGAFKSTRGQVLHRGYFGFSCWSLSVCWRLRIQSQVSQLCQALGKDEDRGLLAVQWFSNPHLPISPPLRVHTKQTTHPPPPVALSEASDFHRQDRSENIDAKLGDGQESAQLDHIPNAEGKHQNNDSDRHAETFVGAIPGPKTYPSRPLAFRTREPTPLKPPASVLTPTQNRALGAEAPQASTQHAFPLPCQKSKSIRERGHQIKTSFSSSKRQQEAAPENLTNARATGDERRGQHVRIQPDYKAVGAHTASVASKQFEPTESKPSFNTKPAENRRPTGEAAKRKRGEERPPSGSVAAAPKRNTHHGKRERVEHSGDEGGSGSEQQPPNRNSHNGSKSNKSATGLPYRCPMLAANHNGEAGRNCKEWHNASIAAVTRHALKDAGAHSAKWEQIRDLSSTKLAPKERWRQYFLIFNDGQEDAEMDRPYWGGTNTNDTIDLLFRCAKASLEPDGGSPTAPVRLLLEHQALLRRREQRDSHTRARADAMRARATQMEQAELLQSQRQFDEDLARLLAQVDDVSLVSGADQPDIPPTAALPTDSQDLQGLAWPTSPMHRTTSGQSAMNATFGTPFNELATNPGALTLPAQSPFPSSGQNPAIGGPNTLATESQSLTAFIENVSMVVDPNTDPTTRQQVQSWQNSHYRQSQTLRPPQLDRPRPSYLAPGHSRRNAVGLPRSSNSTQRLTPTNSSTTNSLQPPRYVAPTFASDDNADIYMGYSETDAPAYDYGGEDPSYSHTPRTY
ncbi:hypothetical protein G647_06733 [Cladophialophora carrionii CBS 160.54]|uniref:Uncharacterized protein n=1 Tax=Cladophialophora carrionii CBS 160.54 TaxID=1279043 RepID=V9D9K9_9EURO|nr:uncharacterized protein G647_06733 [Cladophialophora carrionii CBS 160.54]ETI22657.1 hypothetical protein G647_06733 [Cladophialophora carrionii CBS 160.54]